MNDVEIGRVKQRGITRILATTWGAILALAGAAAAGSALALTFTEITGLPTKVAALERGQKEIAEALADLRRAEAVEYVADSVRFSEIERRAVWAICVAIPPNEQDALAALEITCPARPLRNA